MSEAAIAEALRAGKPVALKFEAPWCGMCVDLDREVLATAAGQAWLDGVSLVRVDFDAEETRPLLSRYAILELPTVVVLGADGREVGRVFGYRDAATWLEDAQHALTSRDLVPALRAAAAAGPRQVEAELALAIALLSRAPEEGEDRLEGIALGESEAAAEALFWLGRFRQRARADARGARGPYRELALRFPLSPYAGKAIEAYARAEEELGRPEAGEAAYAARSHARPKDAGLVLQWARFAGRLGLEPARSAIRAAALTALATARGADRDELEALIMDLGRPFVAESLPH